MSFKDLLLRNRSYRRFAESEPLDEQTLVELVELTRLCPSAANRQPLKFVLSSRPELNARIFPHLSWASELTDWKGPPRGERPSAYIVIMADKEICPHSNCDHGIAAQTMLLGATERGLGGCIIGALNRKALTRELKLPEQFEILMVVALGKPVEQIVVDEPKSPEDVTYWRDGEGVHHVPKRPLEELIFRLDEHSSAEAAP